MRKIAVLSIVGLALSLFTVSAGAAGLSPGSRAPSFKVESGDERELTLEMLRGKQIIIFYEDKDSVEKNRTLKKELNKFFQNRSDTIKFLIVRLPVIDCTGSFWPFKGKWRDNLIENSEKEGIIIYGDWDGDMLEDYRMEEDDSNVILIDQKGIIQYFYAGLVPADEIKKLKTLLTETLVKPSP